MRFFLRRLDSGAVSIRRRTIRKQVRTLGFEQLSSRQLLAGDVESATDDVALVAPQPVESGSALVAPSPAEAAAAGPAGSPLWGDGKVVITQNSENGYGQSYPPGIVDFIATESYGGWTFSGKVEDDEDVEGLTVFFGGLLEGHTTTVQADGTFQLTIVFPPGTFGVVTANVTDYDGLDSGPASTMVG